MEYTDSHHRPLKTGFYFLSHPFNITESKYPINDEESGGDIYFIQLKEDGDFTAQCFRGEGIDGFDAGDKEDFAFRLTPLSNLVDNLKFAILKLSPLEREALQQNLKTSSL